MLLTSSSSKTIIRENFVRYWPVPVLTLIAYILAGIVPVMLNYREFNSISAYAARFVSATGFALNFILAVSCVIASAAVFSYLHDPVSATAIHALPVGRKKLFTSTAVAGWLFVMIPVLIVAFLMLTMRGASLEPGFDPASYEVTSMESYAGTAKEIFTFGHSMAFIFNTFVTATFTYAVCCLSAVLSGKKTIHVLLALFLIVLPTVLLSQIESIFNMFLYGFTSFTFPYSWLSALGWSLGRSDFGIESGFSAFYLALAAVILAGSYYIYKAVRLEMIGNACTFPLVADALCVVLTFIGGLGMAEILVSLAAPSGSNSLRFIVASIAASIFVYIIMRMIADSTPAVFNFTTLKKFLVYFAIMAVFLAFAVGDITHYQTRVPEASEVESVTYTANVPEEAIIGAREYTDKGMIEAVRNLQTALIETKDVDYRNVDTEYETEIEWHLKNGKTIRRFYDERFGKGFEKVEKAAADIYDQKSFRDNILASVDYLVPHLNAVRVYGNDDYDENTGEQVMTYISKEDWPGLTDAIKKDFAGRTFDQNRTDNWTFIIEFASEVTEDADGSYYPEGITRGFTMSADDENTINYLKEKGYYEKMRITY